MWPALTFGPINLWNMPKMSEESPPLYEKIIYENVDKHYQLRLVVSQFKDAQYIHIRRYFLSYEGEWIPSKEGVSMIAEMGNVFALLEGLIEICSYEESEQLVQQFFQDKLNGRHSTVSTSSE